MKTKLISYKNFAKKLQTAANKLKDIHEDSFMNKRAAQLLNRVNIHNTIADFEALISILNKH